jgi:hypothetical protein
MTTRCFVVLCVAAAFAGAFGDGSRAAAQEDLGETSAEVATPSASAEDAPPLEDREEEIDEGRARTRNGLIVYPFAFLRRGFAFAYERAFLDTGLAVLGRLAYDRQAGADFRSNAIGLGLEGRWYFLGRGPFTKYADRAPVGPYFGLRFQWMGTRLKTAEDNRRIGTAHRYTTDLTFGLRMVIAGIIDLTPYVSAAVNTDAIQGLARIARFTAGFGVAIGVLFDRSPR